MGAGRAGHPQALAVLTEPSELIAPDLVQLEVAGAIARRARDGRISATDAETALGKWNLILDESLLTLVPSQEILNQAFRIALEIRHPLPDCLYLAAALSREAQLLTADRTLHDRGRGVCGRIALLRSVA